MNIFCIYKLAVNVILMLISQFEHNLRFAILNSEQRMIFIKIFTIHYFPLITKIYLRNCHGKTWIFSIKYSSDRKYYPVIQQREHWVLPAANVHACVDISIATCQTSNNTNIAAEKLIITNINKLVVIHIVINIYAGV